MSSLVGANSIECFYTHPEDRCFVVAATTTAVDAAAANETIRMLRKPFEIIWKKKNKSQSSKLIIRPINISNGEFRSPIHQLNAGLNLYVWAKSDHEWNVLLKKWQKKKKKIAANYHQLKWFILRFYLITPQTISSISLLDVLHLFYLNGRYSYAIAYTFFDLFPILFSFLCWLRQAKQKSWLLNEHIRL